MYRTPNMVELNEAKKISSIHISLHYLVKQIASFSGVKHISTRLVFEGIVKVAPAFYDCVMTLKKRSSLRFIHESGSRSPGLRFGATLPTISTFIEHRFLITYISPSYHSVTRRSELFASVIKLRLTNQKREKVAQRFEKANAKRGYTLHPADVDGNRSIAHKRGDVRVVSLISKCNSVTCCMPLFHWFFLHPR